MPSSPFDAKTIDKAVCTILAIPRSFDGDAGGRQRNAIRSWLALTPRPEVILFGDDAGVAEAAAELGARHVPEIERTESGTPLFSDALLKGQALASHSVVAYVNSDIILFDSFTKAIDAVLLKGWEKWLLVGRRTNVDFTGTLDFADASAVNEFRERAGRAGVLDLPNGKDYFVFPRGMYVDVPPFGIGRMAFDDWMVGTAIMSGFPVVDCSDVLLAVHPNHDYPHIGKKRGNADDIPDAIRNRSLLDPRVSYNNTTDATWELKNGFKIEHRFTPARTIARSIRKIFSVYMKWLVVYCFAEAVFRLSGRRIVTPTIVPYRTSELSEKDGYIPAIRWNLNYLSGEWLRMRALLKERKFIGNGGAR